MNAPVVPAPTATTAAAPVPGGATPPGPCILVIFGANGDLTRRLVVPALYNLASTHLLPENFAIVGVDHNGKVFHLTVNFL